MVSRHGCTTFDVCSGFTYPAELLTPMFRLSDWVFFLVLDIGTAAFSQLSVGLQVINGLLQATTVRTAGFSVISIAALAPAVRLVFLKYSADQVANNLYQGHVCYNDVHQCL